MNRVLLWLSKSQIRFIGGKYSRIHKVPLQSGREQEILVFTGDKCPFSGQCTIFKTITIHESVLQYPVLFNYVFTHEMAHKQQWWSVFFYPLFLLLIVSLNALVASLFFIVQAVVSLNPVYLIDFSLGFLIFIILFVIPWAYSWLLEIHADFKAINVVGLSAYINIYNVLPKTRPTLFQKIIIRLTHPPYRLTACLWHRFHKEAAVQQIKSQK
jgi:hypothetical protein